MLAWKPDDVVLAGLLALAAGFDVARHRIPNPISVAILVTGLVEAGLHGGWPEALSRTGAAVAVFFVLLVAWMRRAIGGGDLKLAVAAAAWLGLAGLWPYAVASALALGVLGTVSFLASSEAARREIRANLALTARGVSAPIDIAGGAGRVPVPAGAAFAIGAMGALLWGG
jgi:prepilin peptidase CpaA